MLIIIIIIIMKKSSCSGFFENVSVVVFLQYEVILLGVTCGSNVFSEMEMFLHLVEGS